MLLMFHLNMTHKQLMIVYFMHKSHVKVGVQFLLGVRTYLDICILLYNTLVTLWSLKSNFPCQNCFSLFSYGFQLRSKRVVFVTAAQSDFVDWCLLIRKDNVCYSCSIWSCGLMFVVIVNCYLYYHNQLINP